MRYPLASILNLMYKLYAIINIEILYQSGNSNFDNLPLRIIHLIYFSLSQLTDFFFFFKFCIMLKIGPTGNASRVPIIYKQM